MTSNNFFFLSTYKTLIKQKGCTIQIYRKKESFILSAEAVSSSVQREPAALLQVTAGGRLTLAACWCFVRGGGQLKGVWRQRPLISWVRRRMCCVRVLSDSCALWEDGSRVSSGLFLWSSASSLWLIDMRQSSFASSSGSSLLVSNVVIWPRKQNKWGTLLLLYL